jgi:rRNA processing protein Gar1
LDSSALEISKMIPQVSAPIIGFEHKSATGFLQSIFGPTSQPVLIQVDDISQRESTQSESAGKNLILTEIPTSKADRLHLNFSTPQNAFRPGLWSSLNSNSQKE